MGADAFTRAKVIQRGEISFPPSVALVGILLLGIELHSIGQVHSCLEETRNIICLSFEPDIVMFLFGNKKALLDQRCYVQINLFKIFVNA